MSTNEHWLAFPPEFVWGAATSSFQIEGAAFEDGRGMSIWDTFCRTPGKVVNGDTGDIACDHYHRYAQDIDMLAELGVNAYRFSIAWPRILPNGTGAVNAAGLDFYDRLVDGLLAKNIIPYATLYHWDLPQPLEDAGGWPNRATVDAFVEYTDVVSRRLSDRVKNWMTHNEPWCAAFLGYAMGVHAPGIQDVRQSVKASHHLLLSHGRAVPVLRANGDADTRVGIVLNPTWSDPASDSEADKAAAYRMDGFRNRWFLDPVYRGEYPEDMVELFGGDVPGLQDGDLADISAPIDFLGVNYYNRAVVVNAPDAPPLYTGEIHPEGEYTAMDWEVYPESFYQLLVHINNEYNPGTIYITENGAAFDDTVAEDGGVHDSRRQSYLEGHLNSVHRAMEAGSPIKGYFAWSLMDNFEWALGYEKRFGIVYVDFETQERTLKDSALWYGQMIRKNGFELTE